jgi:hypothetical protein
MGVESQIKRIESKDSLLPDTVKALGISNKEN